jgi:hypothetical protein
MFITLKTAINEIDCITNYNLFKDNIKNILI